MAADLSGLSGRAYDRILKVARTIAEAKGAADLRVHQGPEAVQWSSLDRELWV